AYLARILGEKRAREVWYLCRQYSAETMERWGLVNAVVPASELQAEVRRWADEILEKSPTAIKVLKHSFNADSESIAGIGTIAFDTLDLFLRGDEAHEGAQAFAEKRKPDFSKYRCPTAAPLATQSCGNLRMRMSRASGTTQTFEWGSLASSVTRRGSRSAPVFAEPRPPGPPAPPD